jgi:hypothetical protein
MTADDDLCEICGAELTAVTDTHPAGWETHLHLFGHWAVISDRDTASGWSGQDRPETAHTANVGG